MINEEEEHHQLLLESAQVTTTLRKMEMKKLPQVDSHDESRVNPLFEEKDEEELLEEQLPQQSIMLKDEENSSSKTFTFCCTTCNKEKAKYYGIRVGIVFLILYILGVIFMFIWINLKNRRVIQLYGDSLVDVPCEYHQTNSKLRDDFYYLKPSYITEVNYFGQGGARIKDLQNRLHRNLFQRFDYTTPFTWQYADPPDAVILYWDSDVNPGPKDGSSPLNNATVAAYLQTLYNVLDQMTANCHVVILAGPTLTGELPRGQNALDPALDYYAQLNNETARMYNITYINTRDLYFANLPVGWDQYSGYLTVDGEHPNGRGSALLRTAFREALKNSNVW